MSGQMRWMDSSNSNKTKVLHLRPTPADRWQPYTSSIHKQPENGFGIGLTTAQYLLKAGWVYV